MTSIKVKTRQYYSEFGKDNPLPEKFEFLKGVRPHFFAINQVLNKETGTEEVGVEYTVRSAKALLNLWKLHNDNDLPPQDVKKATSKIADLVKSIYKFKGPGTSHTRRRGNEGHSTENERFEKDFGQDIFKSLEILSKCLSTLFDGQTREVDRLKAEVNSLVIANGLLKFENHEFKKAPLQAKIDNKKLAEDIKDLKATAHEDQIKMGTLRTINKGLEEDIILIQNEHRKEVSNLQSEIEKLKSKLSILT